jgi:hypothetical protein
MFWHWYPGFLIAAVFLAMLLLSGGAFTPVEFQYR